MPLFLPPLLSFLETSYLNRVINAILKYYNPYYYIGALLICSVRCGGGGASYNIIMSQSFSGSVPLGYDLYKCFSVITLLPP